MVRPDGKIIYNFDSSDWYTFESFQKRKLELNDAVDSECIDIISSGILRFNLEDQGLPADKRKPIKLYINSPGGSIQDGLGICDIIKSSITEVHTINLASCMSMAFMIFICGHKRYALQHSQFLMHDGSTYIGYENSAKIKDLVDFNTKVEHRIKDLVLQNTKISSEFYDENYRSDFYFLSDEAKQLGVVDYIIGEDCTIDDII